MRIRSDLLLSSILSNLTESYVGCFSTLNQILAIISYVFHNFLLSVRTNLMQDRGEEKRRKWGKEVSLKIHITHLFSQNKNSCKLHLVFKAKKALCKLLRNQWKGVWRHKSSQKCRLYCVNRAKRVCSKVEIARKPFLYLQGFLCWVQEFLIVCKVSWIFLPLYFKDNLR